MIQINRWEFDPKRGLSIVCRNPQLPDQQLKKYLVSKETIEEQERLDLGVFTASPRKRGPPSSSDTAAFVSSKKGKLITDQESINIYIYADYY